MKLRLPGANLSMARDFLALSGGEIVSRLAGFAAFAYLARVLAPEAYGAVELAASLSLLFNFVVDFGVGQIGTREIAQDRGRVTRLAAEIPAVRMLVAIAAIPAMAGTAIAMGQPAETVRLVWLFALGLLAAPWRQQWLLQGLEMMTWISAAGAIRMLVFALGVVVWVREPDDLLAVGVVEIVAAVVLAVYFMVIQQRRITPVRLSFSLPAIRTLLREGLPLGLTQIVWSTTQYLPTMLVAAFVGGAVLAWFGAAHRIVMSLWAFSWLYHFNLFPAVARSHSESKDALLALVGPSIRVTSWAGFGVALVVALLGEPLCRLVFGGPFAVAGTTLSVLVWIVPATLLSGHGRNALIAAGLQRFVLYAQIAGGVVMLGLGVALVPSYGALGAAIAMTVSSFVVWAVSHYQTLHRIAPIPGFRAIYRPLAASVVAAGVVRYAPIGPWLDALAAAALFTAIAFAADRRLPSDIRHVAHARGTT